MSGQVDTPPWLKALVAQFAEDWKAGKAPCLDKVLPGEPDRRLALVPLVRIDLHHRLQHDSKVRVEEYLERFPELARDADGLASLIQSEHDERKVQDTTVSFEEYGERFPTLAHIIGQIHDELARLPPEKPNQHPPANGVAPPLALPTMVGRYRIEKILGKGAFGLVYLALDDQLERQVAIKVPHADRVARREDAEEYLREARIVSSLDHPNIVAVLDVGSTPSHPFFVVSKFIKGCTLAERIKTNRPTLGETIDLVVTTAKTLHYAHKKGIVHRDIKPGNILLDENGTPVVADFGLALREQDVHTGYGIAGTPAYMSPEQARGEGHRVDGRSDLFSLGVIFYELLTGTRPFRGATVEEMLHEVINREIRPPRQWDETIPKEVERICFKALAKRASDRYSTTSDFAKDLDDYLNPSTPTINPTGSASHSIRIVPKGLRSFDAHDADFFLELLPGPRDREGLPDSLRFWKLRIEEMDPDKTFSVGLIYGPSGCGKSSLVKAGLLPRLANTILPIYLEATAEDTEARLLKGLRKQCPDLPANLGLIESLAALRRQRYLPANKKILIVIDQFEQWLHSRKEETNTELVQALRQCDGRYLQCIVMVRDDFWMAATRFLGDLEIPLLEHQNSAAVDLFGVDHARKVLMAFGNAFNNLPENSKETTKEQTDFVTQAIAGLAQEGKVISVRLALFAEMMKGKPWTPATLKALGGTAGVGVTFLEETFSAKTAPPERRYHQQAARAMLQTLLPESGTDIKGHMRSAEDLLAASGYRNRPRDFANLLRILDSEIRLITPTDPEDPVGQAALPVPSNQRFYQLTHDYLVPSLRDWLTRKQKETPRGRAELLLADRAAVWTARPENRQLPSLLQWLQIRRLTVKKTWTPTQQTMMGKANRHHISRILLVTGLTLLLGFLGTEGYGRLEARQLCNRAMEAPTPEIASIVKQMHGYRRWVDPLLREAYNKADQDGDESKKWKAALALLPDDPSMVPYLHERILQAKPEEIVVLRQALVPNQADLIEPLWQVLENSQLDQNQRLRASCALAEFTPKDDRWKPVLKDVAAALVSQEPFEIGEWRDALQPVGADLLPSLAEFLLDESRSLSARGLIAKIYGTYAVNKPDGYDRLEKVLSEPTPPWIEDLAKDAHYKKLASTGLALLAMNHPTKAWPLLEHSPNPSVRSYLIEWLAPGGVDYHQLLDHLKQETNNSVRRAILLSMGQYGLDRIPPVERKNLAPQLLTLYQNDPDPGIHGALSWLLRQWGEADQLKAINQKWATGKMEGDRRWLINGQGQTMAAIPKSTSGLMISTMDVTVAQFEQFCKETKRKYETNQKYAPTKDCPVNYVSWYEAAAYCNWLSKKEEIPEDQWCYQPNKDGKYAAGMKIKKGYLKLHGYRLPTELEWETACRAEAGEHVRFSFGDPVDLLASYSWYSLNSGGKMHPVGKLKPNDFGLFDMHGNVGMWTQNRYEEKMPKRDVDPGEMVGKPPSKGKKDDKGDEEMNPQAALYMVGRGGNWTSNTVFCQTGIRLNILAETHHNTYGFRLARVSVPAK